MTIATVIKEAPDASADAPAESHVGAVLGYVTPGPGKPAIDITPNGTRVERNFTSDPRLVRIENGRLAPAPSLDREGFALTRHETVLEDIEDEGALKAVYYPEMAALTDGVTLTSKQRLAKRLDGICVL